MISFWLVTRFFDSFLAWQTLIYFMPGSKDLDIKNTVHGSFSKICLEINVFHLVNPIPDGPSSDWTWPFHRSFAQITINVPVL